MTMANSLKKNSDIKPAKKQEGAVAVHQSIQQVQYSGPIPQASELEKYEQILPGAADRILKMAEKNADSEDSYRKELLRLQSRDSLMGAVFSFVFLSLLLVVSVILLLNVQNTDGISAVGNLMGGLGTMLSAIIMLYKMFFSKGKDDEE